MLRVIALLLVCVACHSFMLSSRSRSQRTTVVSMKSGGFGSAPKAAALPIGHGLAAIKKQQAVFDELQSAGEATGFAMVHEELVCSITFLTI